MGLSPVISLSQLDNGHDCSLLILRRRLDEDDVYVPRKESKCKNCPLEAELVPTIQIYPDDVTKHDCCDSYCDIPVGREGKCSQHPSRKALEFFRPPITLDFSPNV